MNTVFIADDELIIRQGIKCIIDWEQLGFEIIGEASNGEDALNFILNKQPDLVLMDIRMPKMLGLDVVEAARNKGFNGKVIILSGYTDFKYAQAAIKNGVDYYLTKPIDEDELYETVDSIRSQISKEAEDKETLSTYRDKAKNMILFDILTGTSTIILYVIVGAFCKCQYFLIQFFCITCYFGFFLSLRFFSLFWLLCFRSLNFLQ